LFPSRVPLDLPLLLFEALNKKFHPKLFHLSDENVILGRREMEHEKVASTFLAVNLWIMLRNAFNLWLEIITFGFTITILRSGLVFVSILVNNGRIFGEFSQQKTRLKWFLNYVIKHEFYSNFSSPLRAHRWHLI
jgi:hypothetical protein